jgi:hypothetical protein
MPAVRPRQNRNAPTPANRPGMPAPATGAGAADGTASPVTVPVSHESPNSVWISEAISGSGAVDSASAKVIKNRSPVAGADAAKNTADGKPGDTMSSGDLVNGGMAPDATTEMEFRLGPVGSKVNVPVNVTVPRASNVAEASVNV